MSKRRRFSGELKAKIALEALRGDRTLQEIASKHPVHPNQVSAWKRQAIAGLGEVFSAPDPSRPASPSAPTGPCMSEDLKRSPFVVHSSRTRQGDPKWPRPK